MRHRDAVWLLEGFLALLLLIPSLYVLRSLGGVGTPATVVGLFAFFLWVVWRFFIASSLDRRGNPVRFVVLLFAASIFVTYAAANRGPLPGDELAGADRGIIFVISLAGVALLASDAIDSLDRLRHLLRRIVDLGAIMAGVGLLQYLFQLDVITPVARLIPVIELRTATDFAGTERPFDSLVRTVGTAIHPIEFAVALSMITPIAIWAAVSDKQHRGLARWWKVILLLAVQPTAQSRSGFLVLFIGLLVLVPALPRDVRRSMLFATPPMLVVMRLAFPGLLGTIRNLFLDFQSDPSYTSRTSDYSQVPQYIGQHPWFGRGFGTFFPNKYLLLDNQYLLSSIETGYIGVAVLLLTVFVASGVAMQASRWALDDDDRVAARAVAGAVASATIGMATFDFLSFPMASGLWFLLAGAGGAMWRLLRDEARREGLERPLSRRSRAARAADLMTV